MDERILLALITELKQQGIQFAPGLSDAEIAAAEARFAFIFPPDLRVFLQLALPRGQGFPDWRSGDPAALSERLAAPREGVLFDVEHNGFWLEEWGPRPKLLDDALRIADALVAEGPKLVPIYIHRMMPDEPRQAGNPVFSVHQTDIIHCGVDLIDYLRREFLQHAQTQELIPAGEVRPIRFWDVERFQTRWNTGACRTDPRTLPEDWR